jgi:hypothetical protein
MQVPGDAAYRPALRPTDGLSLTGIIPSHACGITLPRDAFRVAASTRKRFLRFSTSHDFAGRMSQTHAAHDKLSFVPMRAMLPNRTN